MKIIKVLFIFSLTLSAHAYDMNEIVDAHYARVDNIHETNLNYSQRQISRMILKLSGNKMNKRMLNYFTTRAHLLPQFRKASMRARDYSEKTCLLINARRNVDDEVDAMRHILWSSYLTIFFGKKVALEITSLQEVRDKTDLLAMKMDLWNNYIAIDLVAKNRARLRKLQKSDVKKILIKLGKDLINNNRVKIIKTTNNLCARADLYPNL